MRKIILTFVLTFMPVAAFATPIAQPEIQAWDQCVKSSAQDYIDMFGAVSMDAGKMDKAVEDCWDEEFKFSQKIKAEQPQLPQPAVDRLVQNQKSEIRNKWLAAYTAPAAGGRH